MVITHPIRLFFCSLLPGCPEPESNINLPSEQKPPPLLDIPAGERPIGGLGVHFIRTVTDSVTYAREGEKNVLSMEKKRPASL
ncbi:MAG: ATP-binding protein [Methanoculleus sp.]|nr:ATP-binding protein [Methanoculleus sp.]